MWLHAGWIATYIIMSCGQSFWRATPVRSLPQAMSAPLFRKLPGEPEGDITVSVEGRPVRVKAGDSAAAAALLAGLLATRVHPAGGSARAPYCMMGVCFECLMVIDGVPSRQACRVPVREGMLIERQDGRPGIAADHASA